LNPPGSRTRHCPVPVSSTGGRRLRNVAIAAALLAAAHCEGAGLTLRQCIDAAYGLSPALKAEQFDIDAAGQEIIRQRTALLPSVNATASAQVIDGYSVSPFAVATGEDIDEGLLGVNSRQVETTTTRTTTNAKGKTNTAEVSSDKSVNAETLPRQLHRADFAPLGLEQIRLDYPLFQNGSILGLNDAPAVASARAVKQGLEWTRDLGEEKVVFDLCNAFFIAQWYQRKLARDEARVHFSTQRVDIITLESQLKLMLEQDVELAKAQLAADEQTLNSTRQSVKDSWAVLALLIGQPPDRVARLDGNPPAFPALPGLAGLLERAREEHPAVGVQQSVVDTARATYRLDQAALLPSVNFSTSYSLGQNLGHLSTSSAEAPALYAAAVTVSVPVFDWGSRLAEERESRTKVVAEQARESQVKMDVSTVIAKLYDAVDDLEQQFTASVAAQVSADNAARLARQQRSLGAVDQLTLAGLEEALLSAEDTVENTRLTELENYTQLEQAAGGAWRWTQ
jgi:outer membrane protein TolC